MSFCTCLRGRLESYRLRLYVAGQTPKSILAFRNLKHICEAQLLLFTPQLAAGDQILAVPTLVRRLPEPIKKFIGDLSDTDRVIVVLDLCAGNNGPRDLRARFEET